MTKSVCKTTKMLTQFAPSYLENLLPQLLFDTFALNYVYSERYRTCRWYVHERVTRLVVGTYEYTLWIIEWLVSLNIASWYGKSSYKHAIVPTQNSDRFEYLFNRQMLQVDSLKSH